MDTEKLKRLNELKDTLDTLDKIIDISAKKESTCNFGIYGISVPYELKQDILDVIIRRRDELQKVFDEL